MKKILIGFTLFSLTLMGCTKDTHKCGVITEDAQIDWPSSRITGFAMIEQQVKYPDGSTEWLPSVYPQNVLKAGSQYCK